MSHQPQIGGWYPCGRLSLWRISEVKPRRTEFRDGRFTAAIGRTANDEGHSESLCRPRGIVV
jgi:hypothetical protein